MLTRLNVDEAGEFLAETCFGEVTGRRRALQEKRNGRIISDSL